MWNARHQGKNKKKQEKLATLQKSFTELENQKNATSNDVEKLTQEMNALSGKLDQDSITKSIDLREQVTIETNKLDSITAQEAQIDLQQKIAEEKYKVEDLKFQSQLHDLNATYTMKKSVIPDEVTMTLDQQKSDIYKQVNDLDAKL